MLEVLSMDNGNLRKYKEKGYLKVDPWGTQLKGWEEGEELRNEMGVEGAGMRMRTRME